MHSKLIVAAAGSGKTEYIIQTALKSLKRILILTYTNENLGVLRNRIKKAAGIIPGHITVQSWYGFLLKETVRPYQNALYEGARVSTLNFEEVPDHLRYVPAADIDNYYFTKTGKIYRDRVSDFSCKCNTEAGGRTIARLEKMYDQIFVDEVQDMSGWDLEFLDLLLNSRIHLTFVGDVRQATYATNNAKKNKQFRGAGIIKWFEARQEKNKCSIEVKTESYRCNQAICNFADALYPGLPPTTSLNDKETSHDGVFFILKGEVAEYLEKYKPQVLRYSVKTEVLSRSPLNYGQAKGQTFERVLIYPNRPILEYLKTGVLEKIKNGKPEPVFDIAKFYVAVTRAKYSAAIVVENCIGLDPSRFYSLYQ